MSADTATRNELIRDLARSVVSQVAPEEMLIFRAHSDAYFRSPEEALRLATGRERHGPLDFGVEEVSMLLTPVTLAVAASVLTFLLDVLHESMKFEAAHALRDTVRLIAAKRRGEVIEGKPESGQQKVLVLTAEQMALVRRTALEKAILLKLPEEQATLLADAMVGSLSLSPT